MTSEPLRYAVKMHASAVIAFDLDLFSNAHSDDEYDKHIRFSQQTNLNISTT